MLNFLLCANKVRFSSLSWNILACLFPWKKLDGLTSEKKLLVFRFANQFIQLLQTGLQLLQTGLQNQYGGSLFRNDFSTLVYYDIRIAKT